MVLYILKLAFKNIRHKKFRASFTSLSIAIGIASVLLISTISSIGINAMNNELDCLGMNGLLVGAKTSEGESILTQGDIDVISQMDNVESVVPIVTASGSARNNGKINPILIWGIDANAEGIISFQLKNGNDISAENVSNKEYVCLIEEKVNNKIGDTIQLSINNNIYNLKIIGAVSVDSGIMKSLAGDYIPPIIYMPYTTVQSIVEKEEIGQIAVKVSEDQTGNVDYIGKDIERTIKGLKSNNDVVTIQNLVEHRNQLNNMLNAVSIALTAIGIVSLVVAGLSIMAVMLMSVNERTKEIGIKRAIGAGKLSVVTELLVETILICLIGCAIGLVITELIFTIGNNFGFSINLSLNQIVTTIVLTVVGGVLFGIYPSFIASKLNLVDALRKD